MIGNDTEYDPGDKTFSSPHENRNDGLSVLGASEDRGKNAANDECAGFYSGKPIIQNGLEKDF